MTAITVDQLPPLHTQDDDSGLGGILMTAKSKSRKPRSPKPAYSSNIEERIRRRAYELYEQRDKVDGFALEDWLNAESEILAAQRQPKAKAAKGSQG